MQITEDMVTRAYAGQKYDTATSRFESEQEFLTGPSLVGQNAADLIAHCDLIGIESQPDDSERA